MARTGYEIRIRKKEVFGNGDTRKRKDKVGTRKGETLFIQWCSLPWNP